MKREKLKKSSIFCSIRIVYLKEELNGFNFILTNILIFNYTFLFSTQKNNLELSRKKFFVFFFLAHWHKNIIDSAIRKKWNFSHSSLFDIAMLYIKYSQFSFFFSIKIKIHHTINKQQHEKYKKKKKRWKKSAHYEINKNWSEKIELFFSFIFYCKKILFSFFQPESSRKK